MTDEKEIQAELKAMIDGITDSDWAVLKQRFGLDRNESSNEDIARGLFELTQEKLTKFEEMARKRQNNDEPEQDS